MTNLLRRPHAPDTNGCVLQITPQNAGWQRVGFRVNRLSAGQVASGGDVGREACIVVLTGTADITIETHRFERIGGRSSVFDDTSPGAVYAPAGMQFKVIARDEVELAVCSAPGEPGRTPRAIDPNDMPKVVRGKGTNTRYVRNVLPEDRSADSLIVVEVITPGGHWSSYPPHKHDVHNPPGEVDLDEIYYYRMNQTDAFAFQHLYSGQHAGERTLKTRDGDVVLVRSGFHPVVAGPGYDVYYLNFLAGTSRALATTEDPHHVWIRSTWKETDPRLPLVRG